ncbi:MAG: 3-oxoacyl-[acyl-carrier-protein] synthase III C-terminal domain-containing protein [Candidatus Nanopelagicales bacterium]
MSRIVSVASAFPKHRHEQAAITEAFAELVVGGDPQAQALLRRVHANAGVRTRHLALPMADYRDLDGFAAANDAWIRVGLDLGARAVTDVLADVGLAPADVDLLMTVSVTGVAAPSLDARLVPVIGLRPDVKRVPVFGLGCVAGAAGVARLHDHLIGHRDDIAVLLSVELCSLTVQRDDASVANLVASGLFGDGAVAVVAVGARRAEALGLPGPTVVASRSRLYPDSQRVMGWDIGGSGFRIVLDASVAEVVETYLGDDVKLFLADQGLDRKDVRLWVAHPGGPKVLEAVRSALSLEGDALALTWESLASVGNLSSSSVLHVLGETMRARPAGAGEPAVMLAMGPGFCSELVLMTW